MSGAANHATGAAAASSASQSVAASPRRRRNSSNSSTTTSTENRSDSSSNPTTTPPSSGPTATTMTTATASRKTLPPFVDSDETVHFFSTDMVLRTNAIRIVDDVSDPCALSPTRRKGVRTRDRECEDADDDDDECYSDEYDDEYEDDEYEEDEYDEDEYDDDGDDGERERDGRRRDKPHGDTARASDDAAKRAALKARKSSTRRLRVRPSEWSSALPKRNSLRSERIPDLEPRYADVFDAFDDLYSPDASDVDALSLVSASVAASTQSLDDARKRLLRAQHAVATFTRRAHAAKSYASRKRCEFLRVCYQRALETEPLLEEAHDVYGANGDASLPTAAAPSTSNQAAAASPPALLTATRKDDLVETTVPTLHPRKWPHLPFRAPRQWRDNVDDALAFLTMLAVLPATSLQYEPIDVAAFVRDVLALLRAVGAYADADDEMTIDTNSTTPLRADAVAGLAALLSMGVQLQSFTLLAQTALQLIALGGSTRIDAVDQRLQDVLATSMRSIEAQSARPALAATHSRALLTQWKLSACQPATSDAIATDGLFLYVYNRLGLFKIGTGNGATVRDFVYAHNRTYARSRDAERSWLCCIGAHVYCRTIMMLSNRVDRIATDTLATVDELYFSPHRDVNVKGVSESSVYAMVSDGQHLYTIRCIDTLKRAVQAKATPPSDRTAKAQPQQPQVQAAVPAPPKAARDPLVDRILKASEAAAAAKPSDAASDSAPPAEAMIKIGDRVVRGPDWKWGSQDGTEGSVGTVERVSTWGGVAGSGVTVRWDKTQRVNTYRWGAESCYDLVIVVDTDGVVVERKALPTKPVAAATSAVPSKSTEAPLPRHQFVLFQHDVAHLVAPIDLDDDDLDVFLDASSLAPATQPLVVATASAATTSEPRPSDAIGDTALVSTLHEHPLSLCDWTSSWMCDGGLAACSGNNAAKRYRCDSSCDFDLCETCIRATLVVADIGGATDAASTTIDAATTSAASTESSDTKQTESTEPVTAIELTEATEAKEATTATDASSDVTTPQTADTQVLDALPHATSDGAIEALALDASSNLASNPFAIFHASLFYGDTTNVVAAAAGGDNATPTATPPLTPPQTPSEDATATASECTAAPPSETVAPAVVQSSEAAALTSMPLTPTAPTNSTSATASTRDEAAATDPRERERALVDELFACGLYSRKECLVALRRNNFVLSDATKWLDTCVSDLRKTLLVPTVSAVTLTAKPGVGALDPVLLVAGSFYMSSGQLCVVSPPGLYSAGDHLSEKMKRAVTSYDAAWFFSIATGQILSTDDATDAAPVLMRGIPAGSPTCVDHTHGHIFVYSGYLNCLEVYVDPAQSVARSLVQQQDTSPTRTTTTTMLSDMGEQLFAHLHLLMLQRWASPAYKHAKAGLQDILFRTEREPSTSVVVSASKSTPAAASTTTASSEGAYSAGQKSKARRIKNIRGRIETLNGIKRKDPPAYFIPFSIDFEDDSIRQLFRALVVSSSRVGVQTKNTATDDDRNVDVPAASTATTTDWRFVLDVLSLLHELAGEIDFAGVSVASDPHDPSTKTLFARTEAALFALARGQCIAVPSSCASDADAAAVNATTQLLRTRTIETAQAVLAWGIRRGVFQRSAKATVVVDVGEHIVALLERAPTPPALLGVRSSTSDAPLSFATEIECEYAFLHALLLCPSDTGRVDVAEFVPLDFDAFARLLSTLFTLAALEFRSAVAQQQQQQQRPSATSVTVVTKALHSLVNYCSVRLYSEKDVDASESKTKAKGDALRVTPAELFNAFALACVRSSADVLAQSSAANVADLEASVVGAILPLVLTTVSNYPACVTTKVRHSLVDLLQTLDKMLSNAQPATPIEDATAVATSDNDARFEDDQVVESAHPYSQSQSSFRRVVRIPGAHVLHIDFDPRSCTSSEADFVFITAGRAWFNSDRMAFADGGIGDNGGCFFGAYTHGNWPTQGLSIVGDTVTIMLCATSQARDTTVHSEKQRWGLRCTVRGLVTRSPLTPPSSSASWLQDVSSAVASACSVIAEQLMQSVATQPVEAQCRKWLANRALFQPLDRASALGVRQIVEHRKDAVAVLGAFARLHTSPSASMNAKWTDALGLAAAVLVAQAGPTTIASFAQRLTAAISTATDAVADSALQSVAIELQRVEQWMIRHVQLLNEWRYLEVDAVSLDDMKERYTDNVDRVRELCELQNVVFHSADVAGCISRLHAALGVSSGGDAKLRIDVSAQSASAHQLVASEVALKAQLLLSRYTAREKANGASDRNESVQTSSVDTAKHTSLATATSERAQRCVATAGDFFRSTVAASAVADVVQIQSRRLKDRIAGFTLSDTVLTGVSSTALASWFVGRGIVALASIADNDAIDYFSGCTLGDATLLNELDALLRKRYAFHARLASDASVSLLLRTIAAADAYYCVCFEDAADAIDARIGDSLCGTAALIRAVDDASIATTAADSESLHGQTHNAVWILHRVLQTHGLTTLHCERRNNNNDSNHSVAAVTAATRALCAHYSNVLALQRSAATCDTTASTSIARILCMMLPSLRFVVVTTDDATWWLEQALPLLLRVETPVAVSVCAARFCRAIVRACGDRIFDAQITVRSSASIRRIALGRELPNLLIERVGKLVSLLPSTAATSGTDNVNDSNNDSLASTNDDSERSSVDAATAITCGAPFCVVIFLNDETVSKIAMAVEKVAEPDVSHLELEQPAAAAAALKPQLTAAATESPVSSTSMIHRSVRCDGCDMTPLRGYRFKCFTCPNYDLCIECYSSEKHNMDHEFIRLSDSSAGMGDVLPPRSKGGGAVPESSVVGSKHWKGSLVKAELRKRGYALYRRGSAAECIATAKGLAEVGCLATVMRASELHEIDRVIASESQLAAVIEPGGAMRAGRRAAATQKSTLQKADRSMIQAMNAAVSAYRVEQRRNRNNRRMRRIDDVLALASEVIAIVRSMLSDANDQRQWRNSAFRALGAALDNASELLERPSLATNECERRYFEAIGVANVLGGFVEPLRVGGTVARNAGSKSDAAVVFGTVETYALGNPVVRVRVAAAATCTLRSDRVVECTVTDVKPVAEVPVSVDVIKTLEHLAPSFCAVIKRLHGWLLTNKTTSDNTSSALDDCLYRSEIGCVFMRSFACMAPHWASLFDNQIISTHGNIPALLFHLAQLCLQDVGLGNVEREREIVWHMEWLCAQELQFALATRPIKRKSFSAVENADCIFMPLPPPAESRERRSSSTGSDASSPPLSTSSASVSPPSSSECFYNLYAYSSRSDIPQHSGRNKLLEYWEKNVIPAIESYVSGSFKSYEMDYFFAQLREPLREGNSAAALKIAYTLCDGHIPSGCVYPDRDTDWSALQIDEVEVGGRYVISTETLDSSGWPRAMLWTVGHSGVVRLVNPMGMMLLDVLNPVTSEMECWWYHVDNLKPCGAHVRSFADQSVVDFDACGARLVTMNKQLMCSIARRSIFELLQVAPDHIMALSIDHKPRPAASTQLGNRYSLGELLRLAATADLECPDKVAALDASYIESGHVDASDSAVGVRAGVAMSVASASVAMSSTTKYEHIRMLQSIVNKHFDRALSERVVVASPPPPPPPSQRLPFDDVLLPLISKKQTKPVKGAGATSNAALKSSTASSTLSSTSSALASQTKLAQQPDAEPAATPGKYRFLLMESLLRELQKCLDSSAAFLQQSSFTVASESPPKPVALVHVPGATCLVLSFVVHPVLMDLPPGCSLEFFRDEKCSDRIFGYFGEKKGRNYLPPLVVAGDRCYVKLSQGLYARYKFRVDALTSDFGLALWIGEELYHKLLATVFTAYEVETLLSKLLGLLVGYVVAAATCLPCSAKIPVLQLVAKLVNFALGKGLLAAVPLSKLASPLAKELSGVFEHERTTHSGRYSLYTQQLAELLSLLEEVAHLKGASSAPLGTGGAWWIDYVRMATFTRVLVHGGKRESSASPEAFSRIYCGRAPIHEIELAHHAVATRDLFTERLLLVQKLPRTTRVEELRVALARFILHLSLEECGEADDLSVYSAAEVTRFGIVAKVLFLPVDAATGMTIGYAIVDVGREDILANLLVRVRKETLEFDGERSCEDVDLAARIAARVARAHSASESSTGGSHGGAGSSNADANDATQDEQVWSCSVCTLENSIAESECAACGSPIPPELASINRDLASQSESASASPASSPVSVDEPSANAGWACPACTFINDWSESNCITCANERSADQVPPPALASDAPAAAAASDGDAATGQALNADDANKDAATSVNKSHELAAMRFVDALQVAEAIDGDADDAVNAEVPQVADFLRHVFLATTNQPNDNDDDNDDKRSTHLVDALVAVLRAEVTQAAAASLESKRAIDAFTSLMGMKCSLDDVGVDAFVAQATARTVDAVRTQPLDVFQWLRTAGYDLAFNRSHYPSVDAALQSQAKWTFQMDCQLLAMCKHVSTSIGVLMLSELCPSHIVAQTLEQQQQHHLLTHLETRDLRLRFAVLQSLNRLLLHALPLVNLRPWSDPNSLRHRIVSIRQLLFPGVKIRFFAQTQDNTSLGSGGGSAPESSTKRPMVTLDRRKIFGRRSVDTPLSLSDPKRSLFASTMQQLSTIPPSQLRAKRPTGASDPFVAFIVLFAGENVVGEGGPYRQLFHDISTELLAPNTPLFIPTQNNVTKIGDFRERFLPKPSSTTKEHLHMFEFVGLLMGCSLRTGVRLNIRLAPIVWKMLVKQSLAFTDLESVDYSLCESLKYLETQAADPAVRLTDVLYESFTSTLSDGTVVELKLNGAAIPVTKTNCKEYIRLVKATRLQECKPQVDAMLRGMSKIVPVQLLQLCVWTELQQWICGSLDINVELLKRHTRYAAGMSPDKYPHLDMFWRVLTAFSEENKRRFINFAWGQDTLPADDAEFDRTHTRLLIKVPPTTGTSSNQDALLPKADTCFFNIELPAYSSEDVMREKLLLAITLCTSLDGDDQTGHLDIYYAGDDGDE